MKNKLILKCCSTCKIEKPLDDFHNCKKEKYGKAYNCKLCARSKANMYNITYRNTKEFKERIKNYRQSEKQKIYKKIYIEKNKDKTQEYMKKYSQTDKFKQCIKKYQQSEKYKNYKKNIDKSEKSVLNRRDRNRNYVINLHNFYVREQLKHKGFTSEQINNNSELIEVQKIIIQTNRLCKI